MVNNLIPMKKMLFQEDKLSLTGQLQKIEQLKELHENLSSEISELNEKLKSAENKLEPSQK